MSELALADRKYTGQHGDNDCICAPELVMPLRSLAAGIMNQALSRIENRVSYLALNANDTFVWQDSNNVSLVPHHERLPHKLA